MVDWLEEALFHEAVEYGGLGNSKFAIDSGLGSVLTEGTVGLVDAIHFGSPIVVAIVARACIQLISAWSPCTRIGCFRN